MGRLMQYSKDILTDVVVQIGIETITVLVNRTSLGERRRYEAMVDELTMGNME
jgi:hypothetical protein